MDSKSERVLAFVCVLILCIMPVEKGTKADNDITPAPTTVIAELINLNTKQEDTAGTNTAAELSIEYTKIDKCDVDKDATDQPHIFEAIIPDKDGAQLTKQRRGRTKVLPPVCKYTMNEIFLFGRDPHGMTTVSNFSTIEIYSSPSIESEKVVHSPPEKLDVNDTDVKVDEDVEEANMKLKVTDVHSFEEWKSLKLQEQESKLADTEPSPARTVRAKKTQVNYGSQDCGAKVLAHNKEAKHVSAILDENRDLYMLNPCSNPIWFIIELCEPIQVQQVQIGNLELFSSAPKEFVVSVSERYPTREWHSIGNFEAANDKTLQSFNIKSSDVMFAKYIKFEMKSHFSNEHFCPLTLVRVVGISMVDEFDESEQSATKSDTEDDGTTAVTLEEMQQNDSGPINAMLNMVKNAMGLSDKAQNKPAESEGKSKELGEIDADLIDPDVESEITLVTNHTEIITVSGDSPPLITLIKTGDGEDFSGYITNLTSYSPHIPLYVPKFIDYLSPVTQKLNAKVCWFLEFVCKVSLTSCLVHYPFNYSVFVPFSFVPPSQNSRHNLAEENNGNTNFSVDDYHSKSQKMDIDVSPDSGNHDPEDDLVTIGKDDVATVGKASVIEGEHIDDRHSGSLPVTDLISAEPVTVKSCDLDNIENPPLTVDSSSTKIEHANDIIEPVESQNMPIPNTENFPAANVTNSSDEIPKLTKADATTRQPVDEPVLDKQSAHPTVVINPVSPKDSVFMRLSNRIRVLEQNMSLSSAYLENLSRRYKEQMDEMQRAFNKTTSKLVATSRTANENDAKQMELLKKAEAEIEILEKRVQNLSTSHDQLYIKLVEFHFCFIFLELVIFIALFVTCLGRRIGRIQENLVKSNFMIEDLRQIIKHLQEDRIHSVTIPNGHCKSVTVEAENTAIIPVSNNQRNEKKKKRKPRRKNSNGSATAEITVLPGKGAVEHQCTNGVENIGTSANRSCCDSEKAFNANQLGLKIPGTYIKGRK